MLAKAVIDNVDKNRYNLIYPTHEQTDLLSLEQTRQLFTNVLPDKVIHLATYSGNIQFNQMYPVETFYRTTQIGLNVLKCCADFATKKVLSILSSCAIADLGDKELEESDLWQGRPNKSIESHGFAKRNLHAFSMQIHKQCHTKAVCAIVNNCFGPYDSFSPEKTKVVGAFIKKFVDAKEKNLPSVINWGTGIAKRELIYSQDAAKLILLALDKYDDSENPINIGTPNEITIKELSNTISKIVNYNGEVIWDTTKGDGQLRKKLDLTRMNSILLDNKSFQYTNFKLAMSETVNWYMENPTWPK